MNLENFYKDGDRYLCFSLGQEHFAMPLLNVREVIAMPEVTRLPQTHAHMAGIMNLRGQVITVFDLRLKLGIKPNSGRKTAVIICDTDSGPIGVVVDSVNAVVTPQASDMSPKPEWSEQKTTASIYGVFRDRQRLVLLIDVKKTLGIEDVKLMSELSQQNQKTKKAA